MNILQVSNLTKRFDGIDLFSNVNLSISSDDKVGLVGKNGAGKSTLIKMILGKETIDEGHISQKKDIKIGYLEQNTGLNSNKTIIEEMRTVFSELISIEKKLHEIEKRLSTDQVINNPSLLDELTQTYDNIQNDFEAKGGYTYDSEIKSVLFGFGFYEDIFNKKISELSGGQQTQLALAKLLLQKPDLLILDEPTNHIDVETTAWLEQYLQGYNGSLLIISHDRYFMDKITNKIYDLNNGSIKAYTGNYTEFIKTKEHDQIIELKHYEKQQKEAKQLQDFVDKNIVRASTTKRAQSKRKQLEKMDSLQKPDIYDKKAKFNFSFDRSSGNIVLDLDKLKFGYPNKTFLPTVNLNLKKGDSIGIVGPNGIGKSTLIKTIIGRIPKLSGTIRFGTGVTVGYYDQHQSDLHNNKTVLNELWDDYPTVDEKDIRSILGSFLFSGTDVLKTVSMLSGGEKARLLLTKLSMEKDNFLILDEPTNHLDIDSIEVLEKALLNFQGTILFISHDRYFLNKISNNILEMNSNQANLYLGNYDYYTEKKEEERILKEYEESQKDQNNTKKETNENKTSYQLSKEKQKEQRKIIRKINQIEEELIEIDKNNKTIQNQMTLNENITNYDKLNDLQNSININNEKKENLENMWTELSLKLE
ncbi:ATP-binding cassette domain-containing protein [Lactobacillus sp. S2-2]|uniref:ABC-F family ATP-binding cassette domain-containing protein n=1 Tax=Lactobacillus sp. S2-2 TaxID=2692917 RepID=UPI001F2B23D3|nr:ABC-F family ATP-binding cassette domain-containing protein [Lactobacillus sp. S2-2]MCF6515670.1 ATP-binding cassette domain-containing protein [Lactobacillus sp. S2-2]